ncbi:MAG: autotransporter domain-containing protein [Allorhizobium sp.]
MRSEHSSARSIAARRRHWGTSLRTGTALALVGLSGLLPGRALAADTSGYQSLGTLPGTDRSVATGVSTDGSVIVGYSYPASGSSSYAFRWTAAGGMADLGSLGGTVSAAYGVNADGSVVVGSSNIASSNPHAFRWTAAGGMADLGTLGGTVSTAYGVNADGSVVVGSSDIASGGSRAFRWTAAGGMADLGTLGGTISRAYGVNADGSVVVGYSGLGGAVYHAFRWTGVGGMADLGTLGGTLSYANGVNTDGSVVVGYGSIASGDLHAFRWTAAGGMADLGTLGGLYSAARGVNADGSVVVGSSDLASGGSRAFRWTEATGMLSVEDWLRANGVTVASDFSREANGVSADGNIVVGTTATDTAFIARVVPPAPGGGTSPPSGGGSSPGSGVIDVEQFMGTLAAKPSAPVGLVFAGTTLNGIHGEPMRNLLEAGRRSFAVTTDAGYDHGANAEGGFGVADFAYGIGLEGGITARLSAGGLYSSQDIDTGGDFTSRGVYLAPEVSLPLGGGLHATLGGYYGSGTLDIWRGYLNAGTPDYSRGETDMETWGARLRLDWLDAVSGEGWGLTPYTSLTYARSHVDAYAEEGGSFPAAFDSVSDYSTVARLGLDLVTAVADRVRLTGKVEASYRFEEAAAATSGRIIGLSGFSLDGGEVDQFWLRGGIGAEFDTAAGTAFLSLNATTTGDDPTLWLKSGWKVTF